MNFFGRCCALVCVIFWLDQAARFAFDLELNPVITLCAFATAIGFGLKDFVSGGDAQQAATPPR